MPSITKEQNIQILLVEDNPTDVMLTREALDHHNIRNPLHVAEDGVLALEYLHEHIGNPPGLIILDLNLPRKSGKEVLKIIKNDDNFRRIPVVILSTSKSENDILESYDEHANCYITKPVDYDNFVDIMATIKHFWLGIVILPIVKT